MKAFFLVWGIFQSLGFVSSESCVQVSDYVCSEIPTSYPLGLSSLVFLRINVGEINTAVFNDTTLSSVTRLTLTQTEVTSIAPGAFAQFQSLKVLNLHDNSLSQVTSDWFIHKEVLEILILTNNSITVLNGDSFTGLVGLSNLNVSLNQIHTIASESFRSLGHLRHLDLSRNKLRHLRVDTLIPLNNTEIILHGNPWDCSCSVYEFSLYLRELRKASRLQNEMEVLCESPTHQRGRPVWNVSKCENPVTAITTVNSQTETPESTNLSTIISLVVLYHKKQEQKHRVAIQPFPEEQERARQAYSDQRAMPEMSNKVESTPCAQKKKQSNNRLLLKLDQTALESQIYQIYSAGIYPTREMTGRAKSAGPVLSRSDGFGRRPDPEVKDSCLWMMKDEEIHGGWTEHKLVGFDGKKTESKEIECEYGSEEEQVGKAEKETKCSHAERQNDEFSTALKTQVKFEQDFEGREEDEYILKENVQDLGFLHTKVLSEEEYDSDSDDDDEYNSNSSLARSQPQEHDDDSQPLGDVENMPYLTIGADPEKQRPNPEQICTKASTRPLNLRPIRRTLSWPPTAAQWKKHWARTQHVPNVSPKLIFVTQYEYHIGMFPSGVSSAIPENVEQASCSGFPERQLQVRGLAHIQSVEPSMGIGQIVNRSCMQDLSSLTSDYVEINERQSELIKNNPRGDGEADSDSVTIKPLCGKMNSGAASEVKMRSSKKKNTNKTSKDGQKRSALSARQPRRAERDGMKVLRDRQRDQSHSSSGAQPSGGSPSDDNLLEDNEYTFIDLLHEVVENHGRWTRDRWRASHMKKPKTKQVTKS